MPKLGMEVIRRRQVMNAVLTILAEHGWRDLTIREVSEAAGVSAGVVTHYFANKRAMTEDAISDGHAQFIRALEAIEQNEATASEKMAAIATLVTEPSPRDIPKRTFWLAIIGRMPFDPGIHDEMRKFQYAYLEILRRIIREGVRDGKFVIARSTEDIAAAFLAMAIGLSVAAVASPEEMPPLRCRRLLLDSFALDTSGLAAAEPATGHILKGEPRARRREA
jgi:TetR/AcrR family transcriptional regulator, transcriptional repressor of bet genes